MPRRTRAILIASIVLFLTALAAAVSHSGEKYPSEPLTGDYIIHGMR